MGSGLITCNLIRVPPLSRQCPEPECLELDKPGSIFLVVGAAVVLKARNLVIVQARRGLPSDRHHIALVQLHPDQARAVPLGHVDGRLQRLSLRREPESVVEQLGVLWHQLVLQMHLSAIQADGFNRPVRLDQNGTPGRLVHASALHADESRLDDVNAANAVLSAEPIELCQHRRGAQIDPVDGHRVSLLELNLNVLGLVRRVLRRDGSRIDLLLGLDPRVFQGQSLVGDVQQVGIHGVRRLAPLTLRHLQPLALRIGNQARPRVEVPLAPRRNHLDIRLEGIVAQLETDLIISLAGRTVRHRVGADLLGNLNLALGNQGPGNGRPQQVDALVRRIGAEHWPHVVPHKLLAEIVHENLLDASSLGLLPRRLELLALSEIRGKGDHLAVVLLLKPLEDDRRIQTARVRQHHLVHLRLVHRGGGHRRAAPGGTSARGFGGPRRTGARSLDAGARQSAACLGSAQHGHGSMN
mmetsp:Transcript_7376/g.20112  ORF Transcript_7376/g.20112 Transcript_7376/m.20112 type:complete len:469 (-) Transcript_7376:44-1450(-)